MPTVFGHLLPRQAGQAARHGIGHGKGHGQRYWQHVVCTKQLQVMAVLSALL
jgi:hypothetical protein